MKNSGWQQASKQQTASRVSSTKIHVFFTTSRLTEAPKHDAQIVRNRRFLTILFTTSRLSEVPKHDAQIARNRRFLNLLFTTSRSTEALKHDAQSGTLGPRPAEASLIFLSETIAMQKNKIYCSDG